MLCVNTPLGICHHITQKHWVNINQDKAVPHTRGHLYLYL
jgi:hypothetical protein